MPFWSVAHLQPQRHRLALLCLGERGYEVYAPMIYRARVCRRDQEPVLLFSTYIFVWVEAQWHAITSTPGVRRLILNGSVPAKVPLTVIETLKAREGPDGLIHLPRKPPPPGLRKGDKVRIIKKGAFEGVLGLYQGMAPHERVRVLLSLLGAPREVELAVGDIERPQRRARRR